MFSSLLISGSSGSFKTRANTRSGIRTSVTNVPIVSTTPPAPSEPGAEPPPASLHGCGAASCLLRDRLGRDQIRRFAGIAEHLKQDARAALAEHLGPLLQIGGVVLQLAADLQPVADQHGRQLGHQLLAGVGSAAK
jgi:hypothetical protein